MSEEADGNAKLIEDEEIKLFSNNNNSNNLNITNEQDTEINVKHGNGNNNINNTNYLSNSNNNGNRNENSNENSNANVDNTINTANDYKINKNLLNSFVNGNIILTLLNTLIILAIEIILITTGEITMTSLFKKTWWLLIPTGILIAFVIIFCFFNRSRMLNSNWPFYFLPLYIISYIVFIIIISFKFTKVFLSFYILLSVGLSLILIFSLISYLNDKDVVKLIIIYSYSFLHFIGYIILAKKYYVEFFILMVFSFLYFAYLNKELKKLLIEYVKRNELVVNESISLKVVITSFLIIPMDIVYSSFK